MSDRDEEADPPDQQTAKMGSNGDEVEGLGAEDEAGNESEEEDFIPLANSAANKGETPADVGRKLPPWHRPSSAVPGFPLRTLHNEILSLCDLLMPTPDEKARAAKAITFVKHAITDTLGRAAEVGVFGSQLTGLILPSSDIDTVIMGGPPGSLNLLGRAMFRKQNLGEVREVSVISNAKVPLVKFVHEATGMQVDVSFNQASGLESGKEAKALMEQMPPVRPLVMVLKAYMGQRKLNETYQGGIGSFLLQLMVVALVQKCARDARAKGRKPPTNLGFLLQEFFDFYGNQLNYAAVGITLLGQGGGGYYNKTDIGWMLPARPYCLSMQNPHLPSVDVATNSYKMDVCKRSFKSTSLRLRCALERASHSVKSGNAGKAESNGFLAYVVDPNGQLADRALPPPIFATKAFVTYRAEPPQDGEVVLLTSTSDEESNTGNVTDDRWGGEQKYASSRERKEGTRRAHDKTSESSSNFRKKRKTKGSKGKPQGGDSKKRRKWQ